MGYAEACWDASLWTTTTPEVGRSETDTGRAHRTPTVNEPLTFTFERCALGHINTPTPSNEMHIHAHHSPLRAPRSNAMFTWLSLISLALGGSALVIRGQGPVVRLDNAVGYRSSQLPSDGY